MRLLTIAVATAVTALVPGVAQADHGYPVAQGPVNDAYQALGGPSGVLGHATGFHGCELVRGGCQQAFEYGSIYTTPAGLTQAMLGGTNPDSDPAPEVVRQADIGWHWETSGAENGPLGYPTGSVTCTDTACAQAFEGGQVRLDLVEEYAQPVTYLFSDPINAKWFAEGGESGWLGAPKEDPVCDGDPSWFDSTVTYSEEGGCIQEFQGGAIFSAARTGTHTLTLAMLDLHRLGGTAVDAGEWPNGFPTSDTDCTLPGGGCMQHFTVNTLLIAPDGDYFHIDSYITPRYLSAGGPAGPLGYPTGDSFTWPVRRMAGDGPADHTTQAFQGGAIIHTPATGAQLLTGAILAKYNHGDASQGDVYFDFALGAPTADATCGLKDDGCAQPFQNGRMVWSPKTGARTMSGSVLTRWAATGGLNGALGYPVADEKVLAYTYNPRTDWNAPSAWAQQFSGGSIYSSKATGARLVTGQIGARYAALGAHKVLGLPTMDTKCGLRNGGCAQSFQKGNVYWSKATGGHAVKGTILTRWLKAGGVNGRLGYPTTEQRAIRGGVTQKFSGGTLTYKNGRWI